MKKSRINYYILCLLIVLLTANYMLITIIMRDMSLFKYLRDVLLVITLIVNVDYLKEVHFDKKTFVLIVGLSIGIMCGLVKAESMGASIQTIRRYLYPLCVFGITSKCIKYINTKKFTVFMLNYFLFFSAWGIFQAYILKDNFLMKLGYPTRYAVEYGRQALNYSYYFGNLGIQRVVATLSSSNICALILGIVIVYEIASFNTIKPIKYWLLKMSIIVLAYILTFSRSNFVAAIVVTIIFVWKILPYKRQVIFGILVLSVVGVVILMWKDNSIVFKLINWVNMSIHMKDSSSAGRSSIWLQGLNGVIHNPLGVGFGHVGEQAYVNKSSFTYPCENSYLALALDMGWLPMISYVFFIGSLGRKFKKFNMIFKRSGKKAEANICRCGQALIIYLLIAMFFSNYILDMEAITILFIVLSICYIPIKSQKERLVL